ncbi:hypothetical protein KOR42_28230 [Thalassoglobus neptunius]|uniref:Methyltransferase domain-containing protein n=1 Tax=Thalassoglobus neptunius TaxID=1938619 RepID=A0A5C5WXP9_9PLAN|nr:SAM-dependent methyltransferase [Thalassoglobus neptunius]TWT55437.1 hypothetical protein KOR42_28230 [Thalassoglobus neptunius]
MTPPLEEFLEAVRFAFERKLPWTIVLSHPISPGEQKSDVTIPRKIRIRPFEVKGQLVCQWESFIGEKVSHANRSLEETLSELERTFPDVLRDGYLFTNEQEWNVRVVGKGLKLTRRKRKGPALDRSFTHDRSKNYLIPEGTPCAFLHALGIMNEKGTVKSSKMKKFRQINRYLEIVNDVVADLPKEGTLRVVDFGCGLSYLTFALHHLLANIHNRDVQLLGIDQKTDVIDRCRTLADKLQLSGLTFSSGRIDPEQATEKEPVHLALSLHACDTATDAALSYAVRANANVILAVPCCQHQLFNQVENEQLDLILKHGILKERFASMATDALRAAALESCGYRTQILEFIDLEHTPKNLLIRAVKTSDSPTEEKRKEYDSLKKQLAVQTTATDQLFA